MRRLGNSFPIPFRPMLVAIVLAFVGVQGTKQFFQYDLLSSLIKARGELDTNARPVPGESRPTLVVNGDVANANVVMIEAGGLRRVRFFEVYRRRLDDNFGASYWSRWRLYAVVGKTVLDTYVFVDESIYLGDLYEYKARAVDRRGYQIGTWSKVLQRRIRLEE